MTATAVARLDEARELELTNWQPKPTTLMLGQEATSELWAS